jgi:hypothetical protein
MPERQQRRTATGQRTTNRPVRFKGTTDFHFGANVRRGGKGSGKKGKGGGAGGGS